MRISDWSSDVCSSDLSQFREIQLAVGAFLHDLRAGDGAYAGVLAPDDYTESQRLGAVLRAAGSDGLVYPSVRCRSEEHTSELQSLMRISYAVFCLTKKNKVKTQINHEHTTHKPTNENK